ncbi:hypothetical protein MMC32_006544 [Xylographa parallela]|nr:hypothetical protein [Xylographa parallela]
MPEVLRQNQPYVILQGSAFGLWKMCKALQCVGLRLLNELKRENINNAIYSSFLELVVAALDRHQTLIMLTRIQGETLQFPLRLTKTLEATRASMATDPRDKVYAAIGCMSNVQKSSLLVPDYSLPIRTVYGRVVEYMIHTLNNLMIFSTIQPPPAETLTDLPSWIPDWRIPVSTPAGFSSQQSIYDASGGTQARVWIDSEYIELKLAGFSVDTIRHVSTTYTTEHRSCLRLELATFVPFIRDWYSRALLMLGNLYRTGASTLDAFCITRVMGRKDYPRERGSSFPASVLTDRSDTIEVLFNEFSQIELPPESVVGSLHQAVYQAFFISHDGYMGLCPRNTQQGDKIFILLGGNMPAVLRLVKGGYQFIGFAYVYGLMDGEAMVGLETGQYRLQEEITLL